MRYEKYSWYLIIYVVFAYIKVKGKATCYLAGNLKLFVFIFYISNSSSITNYELVFFFFFPLILLDSGAILFFPTTEKIVYFQVVGCNICLISHVSLIGSMNIKVCNYVLLTILGSFSKKEETILGRPFQINKYKTRMSCTCKILSVFFFGKRKIFSSCTSINVMVTDFLIE